MAKPLNVAIVGPSSNAAALLSYDSTWEFWGINSAYRNIGLPRWHRMFNLHRFAHLKRDVPRYVAWDGTWSHLNPKLPFYVIDSWGKLLKNQVIFPRKQLAYQPRADYHASNFDWMVAYAVHLKAQIISIHGCEFAMDSHRDEPISGRACLEYWCGYAEGRGAKIWTGSDCDIFYQYHLVRSRTVYGYDDVTMMERRK